MLNFPILNYSPSLLLGHLWRCCTQIRCADIRLGCRASTVCLRRKPALPACRREPIRAAIPCTRRLPTQCAPREPYRRGRRWPCASRAWAKASASQTATSASDWAGAGTRRGCSRLSARSWRHARRGVPGRGISWSEAPSVPAQPQLRHTSPGRSGCPDGADWHPQLRKARRCALRMWHSRNSAR